MRKQEFKRKRIGPEHMRVVDAANSIISSYAAQGYDLTLRQLYYQFIARDAFPATWLREINTEKTKAQMLRALTTGKIKGMGKLDENQARGRMAQMQWTKNTERNYKNLGNILNDARLAGLVDWHSIVDRTREITEWRTFADPAECVKQAARYYQIDPWENQPKAVELWVEKEALAGVFNSVCSRYLVPFLSCRGYVSASAAFQAFERIEERYDATGQETVILHFGDHDPSGIDMTRDNDDRLDLFTRVAGVEGASIQRLALNWDQVQEHQPPPAPAKVTDSRAKEYIANFGEDSWELDALDPETLTDLAEERFKEIMDPDLWQKSRDRLAKDKEKLDKLIAKL
jgi:hypothetical protein